MVTPDNGLSTAPGTAKISQVVFLRGHGVIVNARQLSHALAYELIGEQLDKEFGNPDLSDWDTWKEFDHGWRT